MTTALAIAMLLVFLRIAAFVVFLPPFSGAHVPQTVKVGLVVALSTLWGLKVVPGVALSLNPGVTESWLLLGWLAIRETIFGASLAWLLGLVLVPIRIAGAYIVQEMGLTMSAVTSATESSETNVISQIFEIAAVLFLFGSNLDHQFFRLLNATFTAFPTGRSWDLPSQEWFINSVADTSSLGLAIAAPIGVVLFVGTVATMFIMRQTPQFNLFTFGTPIRLLLGMMALIWFLPSILTGMAHNLKTFVSFAGL
ncbi:flagellar biosynthetic protein FliR [Planctomicrobium sp. SH527]|uniref:flagellar biosynthetic protein FliR n=1 Tax=Planctomicrobium sp. SH527 TaxID=3448123 RepID=UPI003F5B975B